MLRIRARQALKWLEPWDWCDMESFEKGVSWWITEDERTRRECSQEVIALVQLKRDDGGLDQHRNSEDGEKLKSFLGSWGEISLMEEPITVLELRVRRNWQTDQSGPWGSYVQWTLFGQEGGLCKRESGWLVSWPNQGRTPVKGDGHTHTCVRVLRFYISISVYTYTYPVCCCGG